MAERREPALRALALIAALVCTLASTAGCGGSSSAPPPASPATGADQVPVGTLVMVIRHAEKPEGSTSDEGVDAQGKPDDSSLTPAGWQRANALVGLFAPVNGAPRSGLATPKTIYAAGKTDDGEGLRPRETVMPLAAKLGVPLDTDLGSGQEKKLVQDLITEPGPTLVSWQHEEIPDIAKAFPGVTPKPPSNWPDDRYDVVWTFTRTADGWSFAQLPEMVLPGDENTVITS